MPNKENEGCLFRNKKKERESQPDYSGQAMIGGVEYWISGWVNVSQAGLHYVKQRYNAKEVVEQPPTETPPVTAPPETPEQTPEDDMGLPF